MRSKSFICAMTCALGLTVSVASSAQTPAFHTTFVGLAAGQPALLYEPVMPGPKSAIAVFIMHPAGDYLQNVACSELARRGYRVLCANSTTSKRGSQNDQEVNRVVSEARRGVAWLRQQPGVRKIVLLGHSGGGVMMSAYQAIAEGGVKVCQGPEKIYKCPDDLAGLPPADGVMLLDANYGWSTMMLFSIDPAVTDESTGYKTDPALDMWNPKNGFTPQGAHYSDEFARKWQTAVGQRNNRLVSAALDRLHKIQSGQGRFNDDEPFVVPGANFGNNKFFTEDPRFLSHTHNAWPLLHKDGRQTVEVVHTVRVPVNLNPTTASYENGALKSTVRRFLSTSAIRVDKDFAFGEDYIRGVDWTSSYTTPVGNVPHVTVPLLTMGMTGNWEYMNAELIYEHAGSADKTIAFVEGAHHDFSACTQCEQTAGQFGDTVKTLFDYVDGWLSKPGRFQ